MNTLENSIEELNKLIKQKEEQIRFNEISNDFYMTKGSYSTDMSILNGYKKTLEELKKDLTFNKE